MVNVFDLRKDLLSQREVAVLNIQDKFANNELYLSFSSLSAFRKSPKHFIDYKLGSKEDTDSMLTGQAFHCLTLEPENFDKNFAVAPKVDRRTKQGKEDYENFVKSIGDKTVLSDSIYETALDMSFAVLSNKESADLINKAFSKEKKIFFEKYGFKFTSILDGEGENFIFDLKMMPDADPRKVQREILSRNLWLQAAIYTEAIQKDKDYYIIAVDKSGNVSVHSLMPGLIDYGKSEFKRLCSDFEDCLSTNSWHESYNYRSHNGIFPIDKPQYSI